MSDDAENARLSEVNELVALANRLEMMFHDCYCADKDEAFCDECPYSVDDETCEITKAMDVLEKYGKARQRTSALAEYDANRYLIEYRRVCEENDELRQLCLSMFEEHQRIYDASLFTRKSASSKQMAHWYVECRKHGIGVCR